LREGFSILSSMNPLRLCIALALALGASASERIDLIEFFGYQGLDVDAVRKALRFMKAAITITR